VLFALQKTRLCVSGIGIGVKAPAGLDAEPTFIDICLKEFADLFPVAGLTLRLHSLRDGFAASRPPAYSIGYCSLISRS